MNVDDTEGETGNAGLKWLWIAFLWCWASHGGLSIHAQAPPQPRIVSGQISSEGFEIVMEGEPRVLYRLEESNDLASWIGVSGGLTGTNGAARFVVPSFGQNEVGRVFYRVARQEVQPGDARTVWQSSGMADYRYRIEYHAGRAYLKAAVQVENGRVVSIEQVEGLSGLTNDVVKPLPEYFDLLEQSGEVMVDFSPGFGYPTSIRINPGWEIVDAASSYLIQLEEVRLGDPVNGWAWVAEVPFQEERRVNGGRLGIRFNSLEGDSRCPIGVVCVWEGVGIITLQVEETGAEPELLRLATTGQATTVNYRAYGIKLQGLWPYPRHGRTVSDRDYVATLLVWRR